MRAMFWPLRRCGAWLLTVSRRRALNRESEIMLSEVTPFCRVDVRTTLAAILAEPCETKLMFVSHG